MLRKPLSSSSRFTALVVWHLVKKKRKMIRSRLLWFTLGFSVTSASIAQFIYKDLWNDRYALKSDVKQKFDALETRVSNLESLPPENPNPAQVEG